MEISNIIVAGAYGSIKECMDHRAYMREGRKTSQVNLRCKKTVIGRVYYRKAGINMHAFL